MNIYIDPHAIAYGVSLVLALASGIAWGLLSRRLVGFLVLVGICGTLLVETRSDLVLAHMEAIAIVGAIITALLAIGFILVRASWRRSRVNRARRPGRQQTAMPIAQPQREQPRKTTAPVASTRTGASRAALHIPSPEYGAQELPDFEYDDWADWDEEDEVTSPPVRQPVRQTSQHHSARSRARYTVNPVNARQNVARGARLQGGR